MSESTVLHSSFELERVVPAQVGDAFAAWADPATKARWFATGAEFALDFRVGGLETVRRSLADGRQLRFEAVYRDILVERRLVFHSALWTDERLSTAAVTTVLFAAEATTTRLSLVEQGTFLDGLEQPERREQGTGQWLDAFVRTFAQSEKPV